LEPLFSDFYEEKGFSEECKKCSLRKLVESKGGKVDVYSWEAGSPIGFIKIQGCSIPIPCKRKRYVFVFWGVIVEGDLFYEIKDRIELLLQGKVDITKEAFEVLKKLIGFYISKDKLIQGLKNTNPKGINKIEKVVRAFIKADVSGWFKYPYNAEEHCILYALTIKDPLLSALSQRKLNDACLMCIDYIWNNKTIFINLCPVEKCACMCRMTTGSELEKIEETKNEYPQLGQVLLDFMKDKLDLSESHWMCIFKGLFAEVMKSVEVKSD